MPYGMRSTGVNPCQGLHSRCCSPPWIGPALGPAVHALLFAALVPVHVVLLPLDSGISVNLVAYPAHACRYVPMFGDVDYDPTCAYPVSSAAPPAALAPASSAPPPPEAAGLPICRCRSAGRLARALRLRLPRLPWPMPFFGVPA
jgi:hypothetical protein